MPEKPEENLEKHAHKHQNIPEEYRKFWEPYITDKTLMHLTTRINLENIKKVGHIEPRDPAPKHWAGMKAIFLSDSDDLLYVDSLKHVLAHVQEKQEDLIRLHIKTKNELYKSTDPARTFQVISLDPISIKEILELENLKDDIKNEEK